MSVVTRILTSPLGTDTGGAPGGGESRPEAGATVESLRRKEPAVADPDYTSLLIVLDRSGSMFSIRDEMVAALDKLIDVQAALPGLLTVDVFTFDDLTEHTHVLAAPEDVRIQLEPRGGTALYDAVGGAINGLDARVRELPEHTRPGTVQVVIVTDGFDNRSTEFTASMVRSLIERQRDQHGWEFVFLGADQDAVTAADDLGIAADRSMTFSRGGHNIDSMTQSVNRHLTQVRRREDFTGFTRAERAAAVESDPRL